MIPHYFLSEIKRIRIEKYKKKKKLNFGADSLDYGPILDNLEINP